MTRTLDTTRPISNPLGPSAFADGVDVDTSAFDGQLAAVRGQTRSLQDLIGLLDSGSYQSVQAIAIGDQLPTGGPLTRSLAAFGTVYAVLATAQAGPNDAGLTFSTNLPDGFPNLGSGDPLSGTPQTGDAVQLPGGAVLRTTDGVAWEVFASLGGGGAGLTDEQRMILTVFSRAQDGTVTAADNFLIDESNVAEGGPLNQPIANMIAAAIAQIPAPAAQTLASAGSSASASLVANPDGSELRVAGLRGDGVATVTREADDVVVHVPAGAEGLTADQEVVLSRFNRVGATDEVNADEHLQIDPANVTRESESSTADTSTGIAVNLAADPATERNLGQQYLDQTMPNSVSGPGRVEVDVRLDTASSSGSLPQLKTLALGSDVGQVATLDASAVHADGGTVTLTATVAGQAFDGGDDLVVTPVLEFRGAAYEGTLTVGEIRFAKVGRLHDPIVGLIDAETDSEFDSVRTRLAKLENAPAPDGFTPPELFDKRLSPLVTEQRVNRDVSGLYYSLSTSGTDVTVAPWVFVADAASAKFTAAATHAWVAIPAELARGHAYYADSDAGGVDTEFPNSAYNFLKQDLSGDTAITFTHGNQGGNRTLIPAYLVEGGGVSYLDSIRLSTRDNTSIDVAINTIAPGETDSAAAGPQFTQAWEQSLDAMKLITDSATFTIAGPDSAEATLRDQTEPLSWRIPYNADLAAWIRSATAQTAATLRIGPSPDHRQAINDRSAANGGADGSANNGTYWTYQIENLVVGREYYLEEIIAEKVAAWGEAIDGNADAIDREAHLREAGDDANRLPSDVLEAWRNVDIERPDNVTESRSDYADHNIGGIHRDTMAGNERGSTPYISTDLPITADAHLSRFALIRGGELQQIQLDGSDGSTVVLLDNTGASPTRAQFHPAQAAVPGRQETVTHYLRASNPDIQIPGRDGTWEYLKTTLVDGNPPSPRFVANEAVFSVPDGVAAITMRWQFFEHENEGTAEGSIIERTIDTSGGNVDLVAHQLGERLDIDGRGWATIQANFTASSRQLRVEVVNGEGPGTPVGPGFWQLDCGVQSTYQSTETVGARPAVAESVEQVPLPANANLDNDMYIAIEDSGFNNENNEIQFFTSAFGEINTGVPWKKSGVTYKWAIVTTMDNQCLLFRAGGKPGLFANQLLFLLGQFEAGVYEAGVIVQDHHVSTIVDLNARFRCKDENGNDFLLSSDHRTITPSPEAVQSAIDRLPSRSPSVASDVTSSRVIVSLAEIEANEAILVYMTPSATDSRNGNAVIPLGLERSQPFSINHQNAGAGVGLNVASYAPGVSTQLTISAIGGAQIERAVLLPKPVGPKGDKGDASTEPGPVGPAGIRTMTQAAFDALDPKPDGLYAIVG